MTATLLSSTTCRRLKIVRARFHTFTRNMRNSAVFPPFRLIGEPPTSGFGCPIHGRLGHDLDTLARWHGVNPVAVRAIRLVEDGERRARRLDGALEVLPFQDGGNDD
jgi:hypothetical protein